MRRAHLARHRWPKRHDYVVEQCRELHVSDLLPRLPDDARQHPVPTAVGDDDTGWFVLAPKRGGLITRWWLVCFGCKRLRESLYVRPDSPPAEWRCRVCSNLIYASQRHSPRHRLRRDPRYWTHRKRRGAQKATARTERKVERSRSKQAATQTGVATDTSIDMEAIIEHGREMIFSIVHERQQAQEHAQRSLADALRAAVAPALAALERIAAEAPQKRVRNQARRTLARHRNICSPTQDDTPHGEVIVSPPPAPIISADTMRFLKSLLREASSDVAAHRDE